MIIAVSDILSGGVNLLTLVSAWVGITSLIFAAKGNVWAQILMIVFSILYGIISWQFRYWGEMITYLVKIKSYIVPLFYKILFRYS